MSTRARTRSATAASHVPTPQPPPRSRRNQVAAPTEALVTEEGRGIQKHDSEEKENHSKDVADRENGLSAAGRNVKRKLQTNGKAKGKGKAICTCRGQDDGTPMIECSRCGEWYHFTCIQLSENDAEDIRIYICPPCAEKTSERTIMDWEGAEAVEEVKPTITIPKRQNKPPQTNGDRKNGATESNHVAIPSSESEGDADSEDDYVSEAARSTMKGKRRIARQSSSDESDGMSQDERPGRRRLSRQGGSPSLKRKRTTVREPVPKRKKSESEAPAEEDPARKYCLGKLAELFSKVFLKYPHLHVEGVAVEKQQEELTDDDKRRLEEAAKEFSTGLEQCVFDIYSEPDKAGRPHAGAKYKDRFRMLQFNLGKDDRVVIHKRIASAQITPKEISMMSSTDLANEETKQSIKQLEQEALEHSILQKATVPRAKITHKGFQDIEDENGLLTSTRELERERERQVEEEERIERERLARLRSQRQRTQSVSVPPESPLSATGQSPARWGAPPPLPSHVSSTTSPLDQTSASDTNLYPLEPELNLADLINIDDDLQVATNEPPPSSAETDVSQLDPHTTELPTVPTTGISPFSPNAPKADTLHQASFDLNAIWTAPTSTATDQPSTTPPGSPPAHYSSIYARSKSTPDSEPVAEDQDFDMFLEEPTPETPAVADPPSNNLDSLPPVWSGKISMPLDSTIPQETPVVARQVGGRTLVPESLLWKTLFPSDILRIEGRVPVDKSAEYLLQMRMNASKELISAAFSPATEQDTAPLQIISDFLIGKGRHGLIFPWGHRPKDHHPGRELYIIPLLSTEPLPEYIELLDDLKLPKVRTTNCLIGIWILQKGKLAPPINTFIARPQTVHEGPSTAPSIHPPAIPTPPFPPVAPPIVPQIEPAVLAAEVASLTPEQIQMMLRTLTSGSAVPIPVVTDIVPPPPPAAPPAPPAHWGNNVPTFSQGGGPPPPFPPYNDMRSNHNDRPYGGDRRDSADRGNRGDRGGRGRSRGRGRARRDDDEFTRRPSDSGWPRRHRGDYRGDDYRKEQWT